MALAAADPSAAQSFEVTPFGGVRFGGEVVGLETSVSADLDDAASYGLILGIPWKAEDRSRLELVWSWQPTAVGPPAVGGEGFDLDIHYLHLGGMAPFATPSSRLEALLSGGLGVTFMAPDLKGARSEVYFSLSLGAGLLYRLADRAGIRLEARGWYSFTEAGGGVFCAGGCVVAFSGSGFGQGEVTAGLQLSF